MQCYLLTIHYKGSNYCGWQVQPGKLSIQAALEAVLQQVLQSPIALRSASRTDAGVHAWDQKASFDIERSVDSARLLQSLRSLLPADIIVTDIRELPADFDVQRRARSKTYFYLLKSSEIKNPWVQDFMWQVHGALDADLIRGQLTHIVGRHDFSSFAASDHSAEHCVRQLHAAYCWDLLHEAAPAALSRDAALLNKLAAFAALNQIDYAAARALREQLLVFVFQGEGFVKQMIRNLVGSLYDFASGAKPSPDLASILKQRSRRAAGLCAPACGLHLWRIEY